ncbi:MAG: hypothetical protein ACOY3P_03360 [Planctomycetota bacterium]
MCRISVCMLTALVAAVVIVPPNGLTAAESASAEDPSRKAAVSNSHAPGIVALQPQYPKAVHYRYANNFKVRLGGEDAAYRAWAANYGNAMGAELDGRVTLTDNGRRQIIERFKREHPEQFLIFYSTGHIKIPTEASDPASGQLTDYSQGHWVYLPRVRVLHDVKEESGVSELRVAMPKPASRGNATADSQNEDVAQARTSAAFSLRADRGDDICLYTLKADGSPDWERAEQVRLVGLDELGSIIRVQRGCYGTQPRAHAGEVYVAVHAEVTKFQGWWYNFSTFCPRDPQGRTAGEIWAEAYGRIFQPGGSSAHFDALQLDTLMEDVFAGRGCDINNNGIDDAEEDFGGVNWFAVGVCEALEKLRAYLPADKLLLPDAGNRGFAYVNGWEVEGFPGRHDPAWRNYSEVCNRLELSRCLCQEPQFTQVQHKIFNYTLSRDGAPEILSGNALPFSLSRAVLGLSTIHEAAVTWYSQPPRDPLGRAGVYDEICMGAANQLGWLGLPKGDIIYLGLAGSDLSGGALQRPERFVASEGTRLESRGNALLVSHAERNRNARVHLAVTPDKPELLVVVRWRGEPRARVRARIPRHATVSLAGGSGGEGYLLPADGSKFEAGVLLPDGTMESLPPPTARVQFDKGWHTLRFGIKHDTASHLVWQVRRRIDPGSRLSLAAYPGTGAYSVEAAEVQSDGTTGTFQQVVAPFTPIGPTVFHRNVAMDPCGFGGKDVMFRFLTALNRGRGSAAWCEVALGRPVIGDLPPAGPIERRIGGFVAQESVRQAFHFNHVPSGFPLELALEFEGGEPVEIEELGICAGSGAVAREFEHGVVLANPSLHEEVIDLERLFPGASFRRFQATANQDTAVNNGKPVGAKVTVASRDGLFLAREGSLEKLGVPVKLQVFDEGAHGVGNLIPERVRSE